ncbi:MAG: ferritin family protein [Phycisphaerae bacterium]
MTSFSAVEVYGLAEQIERNGVNYYTTAAEKAGGRLKDLLLELAEMEADHEKTFQAMREELNDVELSLDSAPGNQEIGAYLRAMAEGRIFDLRSDPSARLADGSLTGQAVLRKAIDMEKDSIIFYLGLEGLVPSEKGQQQVHQIIREEICHIGMLSDQLVKHYA